MNSVKHSRGMVTAELAISIMAATIVAALLAWSIGLVATQARCEEIAARVARFESRGDEEFAEKARANAPEGADVQVTEYPDRVQVSVTKDAYFGRFGPVALKAAAVVPKEG